MKISLRIFIASLVFILAPIFVFAHEEDASSEAQAELPAAGITPSSPLYVFDRLSEFFQDFFTLNPAAKARLHITLAAERIAEIKVELETKGIAAKGLEIAKERLAKNISRASAIMEREKARGRDVSELGHELGEKFMPAKQILAQAFKDKKKEFKDAERILKDKLQEARKAGDLDLVETLVAQIKDNKEERQALERGEVEIDEETADEEEDIASEADIKDQAEEAIAEAEEEKAEIEEEAAEEGLTISVTVFQGYENLIAKAMTALEEEKYADAKLFAEQAEKALSAAENLLENKKEDNETKDEEDLEEHLEAARGKSQPE